MIRPAKCSQVWPPPARGPHTIVQMVNTIFPAPCRVKNRRRSLFILEDIWSLTEWLYAAMRWKGSGFYLSLRGRKPGLGIT